MQELFGVLVLQRNGVEISDLCGSEQASGLRRDTPCALSRSSLPCSVSWKAGLMNESPGPENFKILKCAQKKERYSIKGKMMRPMTR